MDKSSFASALIHLDNFILIKSPYSLEYLNYVDHQITFHLENLESSTTEEGGKKQQKKQSWNLCPVELKWCVSTNKWRQMYTQRHTHKTKLTLLIEKLMNESTVLCKAARSDSTTKTFPQMLEMRRGH